MSEKRIVPYQTFLQDWRAAREDTTRRVTPDVLQNSDAVILASGSRARVDALQSQLRRFPHTPFYSLSPEAISGKPESADHDSAVVAAEKNLTLAIIFGLIQPEDQYVFDEGEPLLASVLPRMLAQLADVELSEEVLQARSEAFTGERYVFIASDNVNRVAPTEAELAIAPESTRIQREYLNADGTPKTLAEIKEAIAERVEQLKAMYCNPEGFVALFEVSQALLIVLQDEITSLTYTVELLGEFDQIEEQEVEEAFSTDESPGLYSATGLDLINHPHLKTIRVRVKEQSGVDERTPGWVEIDRRIATNLVRGGVLPDIAWLQLLGGVLPSWGLLAYQQKSEQLAA